MDKTDLSLTLAAFSALALILGVTAALVTAAFIVGLPIGQKRRPPPAQ
jgi:hypothetical protein